MAYPIEDTYCFFRCLQPRDTHVLDSAMSPEQDIEVEEEKKQQILHAKKVSLTEAKIQESCRGIIWTSIPPLLLDCVVNLPQELKKSGHKAVGQKVENY